jgi:uncharacterized membrane protein
MRMLVFLVVLSISLLAAFWKGGQPERFMALVIGFAIALSWALASNEDELFIQVEVGVMVIDGVALFCMAAITLHADRYWPIWITAFQIIQLLAHLPEILIPQLLPSVYGLMISVWSYPMLLILLAGTVRHQQRIRLYGNDRAWSEFSVRPV